MTIKEKQKLDADLKKIAQEVRSRLKPGISPPDALLNYLDRLEKKAK
jgi:hypothetical protein